MALSMMGRMLNQGPKEQICLILNQVTWFDVLRPGINSYCNLYVMPPSASQVRGSQRVERPKE